MSTLDDRDRKILELLKVQRRYNELWRKIESSPSPMSSRTFNKHLKRLVEMRLVQKEEASRNEVYYRQTDAENRHQVILEEYRQRFKRLSLTWFKRSLTVPSVDRYLFSWSDILARSMSEVSSLDPPIRERLCSEFILILQKEFLQLFRFLRDHPDLAKEWAIESTYAERMIPGELSEGQGRKILGEMLGLDPGFDPRYDGSIAHGQN